MTLWIAASGAGPARSLRGVTDPRTAAPPGDSAGSDAATGVDVAPRIEAAGHDIVGVSEGPLAEAVVRLDVLHRELQGALADLDQA